MRYQLSTFENFQKIELKVWERERRRLVLKLHEENDGDIYCCVPTTSAPKMRHQLSLNLKVFKIEGVVSVLKFFKKNDADLYFCVPKTHTPKMGHKISPNL